MLLESMLLHESEFRQQHTSTGVTAAIPTLADLLLQPLLELPHTHWPARLTILQAQALADNNPLWDEVGLFDSTPDKHPAGMQAAVMLQHMLDEECGGWANTFG